jgi:hypothetical protein
VCALKVYVIHIRVCSSLLLYYKTTAIFWYPKYISVPCGSQGECGFEFCVVNKKSSSGKNLLTTFLWYDTDRIENDASNNYFIVACVFVAAVAFLPSRCLATIGGMYIETHRLMEGIYEVRHWDGLRCHDIDIKFHKGLFSHSEITRGIHRHTDSMVIS